MLTFRFRRTECNKSNRKRIPFALTTGEKNWRKEAKGNKLRRQINSERQRWRALTALGTIGRTATARSFRISAFVDYTSGGAARHIFIGRW